MLIISVILIIGGVLIAAGTKDCTDDWRILLGFWLLSVGVTCLVLEIL